MNHIARLKAERDEARARLTETEAALTCLLSYLSSSKFHDDNTVQVRTDIAPKLMDIRSLTLQEG